MTDPTPNAHREARPVHTTVLDEAIAKLQAHRDRLHATCMACEEAFNWKAARELSYREAKCIEVILILGELRSRAVCREANSTQLQVTEDAGTPLV